MTTWVKLEELNRGDETIHPSHPFEQDTFADILDRMDQYREIYPECLNFRIERQFKSHGYGAVTIWYELQGLRGTDS